jgi:hypothetical protein
VGRAIGALIGVRRRRRGGRDLDRQVISIETTRAPDGRSPRRAPARYSGLRFLASPGLPAGDGP